MSSPMTLREGLSAHLETGGLPEDGGYDERWVKLRIGPIPFAFPNTQNRRRLVPLHDLHHVVTGYATDLVGEAELAAWEIGSGMRDRTGLRLARRVLGFLLPRRPRKLFRAFVHGRNSRNLLDAEFGDPLLDRTIEDVRRELALDRKPPPATAADRRAFSEAGAVAVAIVWGPLAPMAALAWLLLR